MSVDTSIEAFVDIQPHVGALCKRVLDVIKHAPDGMTCEEVELKLDMKHQTTSARINELANMQPPLIYKRGKRANLSGRNAAVWFLSETT
tara:strand:+ start:199 stop:468 length:270 start_codon:yes stop_codon:yes gene_type:complete